MRNDTAEDGVSKEIDRIFHGIRKWLMKMTSKIGPKTLPRGTAAATGIGDERIQVRATC